MHFDILGNYSVYGFEIQLTRSLGPFILSIYLPSAMFVMMSWVSFFVPPVRYFKYFQTLKLLKKDGCDGWERNKIPFQILEIEIEGMEMNLQILQNNFNIDRKQHKSSKEIKFRWHIFQNLFWSSWYQIDTNLPFSLYLRHGFQFHSESEQPDQNRVKPHINSYSTEIRA